MIEWKEYKPGIRATEKPSYQEFLILTGTEVNIASHVHDIKLRYQWWLRDGTLKLGVTHYAAINLPE